MIHPKTAFKHMVARAINFLGYVVVKDKSHIERAFEAAIKLYQSMDILFIDGGANIGQSIPCLVKVLKNYSLKLKAIGFEPVESNFRILKDAANECKAFDYQPIKLALSNQKGKLKIHLASHEQCHSIENNEEWKDSPLGDETIETATLDELLERQQLNNCTIIVKLNIEGHELSALSGMKELLRSKQNLMVIVEVGFASENKQIAYFPPVYEYMEKAGFKCIDLTGVAPSVYEGSSGSMAIKWANAIFAR